MSAAENFYEAAIRHWIGGAILEEQEEYANAVCMPALAAVALTLIGQGKNVMMVDTDIEAPGLATLFFDEELIDRGVLDYLIEHEIDDRVSVTDYVLDVTNPALLEEHEGQLFLMPAGKVDENYLQKLARIDFQDNRPGYLREALTTLLTDIKENYDIDYILIDARA